MCFKEQPEFLPFHPGTVVPGCQVQCSVHQATPGYTIWQGHYLECWNGSLSKNNNWKEGRAVNSLLSEVPSCTRRYSTLTWYVWVEPTAVFGADRDLNIKWHATHVLNSLQKERLLFVFSLPAGFVHRFAVFSMVSLPLSSTVLYAYQFPDTNTPRFTYKDKARKKMVHTVQYIGTRSTGFTAEHLKFATIHDFWK